LRPFDPLHPFVNPGAWELVALVSHMQVDPSIFRADPLYNLAKATGNSDAATELSVGFNWYLNSLVRMQFNWEHAWFQQPLLLGPGTFFRQTDAVLMRFQIIF
jgi:phosphate-selective porin OprO/OprP